MQSVPDKQPEVLFNEDVPSPARATLFTVTAGNLVEMQSITLINCSGVLAMVNVFLVHEGLDIRLNPCDLNMSAGDLVELVDVDNKLKPMIAGDKIDAISDQANVEINGIGFLK